MTGAWTAAAIAALAAGIQYQNTVTTAKKQDNSLASELRQQGLLQQQAQKQTGDLIQKTAASNDTGAKASVLDQFLSQMQTKQQQGGTKAGLNQVGAVSGAYAKAANDAASGISTYGDQEAGLLSSIDAPSIQRQNEAADLSRYGSGIGAIKQQSSALNFLEQMKLKGIAPNPWLTAASTALNSYASSTAGGGSYGSTGTALGTTDGAGPAGGAAFGGSVGYGGSPGFGGLYSNFQY